MQVIEGHHSHKHTRNVYQQNLTVGLCNYLHAGHDTIQVSGYIISLSYLAILRPKSSWGLLDDNIVTLYYADSYMPSIYIQLYQ